MNNVKPYIDQQIIARVESHAKGFNGWRGIVDVWIRSSEDAFDRFDDKVYTFDCSSGKPKFIMVCSGTSNAGSYGLKNYNRYNSRGCAILCADTITYDSHVFGYHKRKNNHPAYIQARGIPYTRDFDKDNKSENYGQIFTDIIGANCHRAAGWGVSLTIYNFSVGCLVRNSRAQFDKWLTFMDKRKLSVVILNEW